MARGSVHVGTSGFVYDHWIGTFYPQDLPAKERFAYYAERFGTVEINNTFYRLPDESVISKWRAQAPPGFVYAFKASRYVTHRKRLLSGGSYPRAVETMLDRLAGAGERGGGHHRALRRPQGHTRHMGPRGLGSPVRAGNAGKEKRAFLGRYGPPTPALRTGGAAWVTILLHGVVVGAVGAAVYATFRFAFPRGSHPVAWQRLQVYRAKAELGASKDELEALRERLGISPQDAREIRRLVEVERGVLPEGPRGPLAEGALLLGRYDVGPPAGVGAFGRIHDAVDRIRGERVVLKELNPRWHANEEALRRFRQEAEVALRLDHPNLVAFRAFERVAGGHVLVLARVEGETLAQRLARGPLSSAQTARIARDLLSGLAALHAAGIVHRDVKPQNVMLRPDGRAVLLDFGCAARTKGASGTRLAGARQPGTPEYVSPEQARGGPVTPASDLYALGLLLRECLTGTTEPQGRAPSEWEPALALALDPDPRRRWARAEDLRRAVERIPVAAPWTSRPEPTCPQETDEGAFAAPRQE